MSLRAVFGNDFARKAFQIIDGETRVLGKFGEIALNEDGSFDIWLVKPGHRPVGARKLNNMIAAITSTSWEVDIHILTGEAWLITKEADFVREIAPLLGIPKRRTYSEATLKRMREQAAKNLKGAA